MTERPPNDPYPSGTLHLWNTISWVLLGLLPTAVAVLDADEAKKYWSWSLLILIALCYAVVVTLPRNPVLRPKVFLVLLSLVMGGISCLLGGAAAYRMVNMAAAECSREALIQRSRYPRSPLLPLRDRYGDRFACGSLPVASDLVSALARTAGDGMATATIETGSKSRTAGPARPVHAECVAVSGGA